VPIGHTACGRLASQAAASFSGTVHMQGKRSSKEKRYRRFGRLSYSSIVVSLGVVLEAETGISFIEASIPQPLSPTRQRGPHAHLDGKFAFAPVIWRINMFRIPFRRRHVRQAVPSKAATKRLHRPRLSLEPLEDRTLLDGNYANITSACTMLT
jgi:hypothetical protein